MQPVLKMQYISLLPKYIKWIEWCLVHVRSHVNTGHLKVKLDYDCSLHNHLELIICIFIFKTTYILKPCSSGDKIFFPSVSKFQNKSLEFAIFFVIPYEIPGCWEVLSPTRKETSSEACQGHEQFQQHRDASCHQGFLPARQVAEGNSCHSDRNISLFSSWSG